MKQYLSFVQPVDLLLADAADVASGNREERGSLPVVTAAQQEHTRKKERGGEKRVINAVCKITLAMTFTVCCDTLKEV